MTCPKRPEEGAGFPRAGVTEVMRCHVGGQELSPGLTLVLLPLSYLSNSTYHPGFGLESRHTTSSNDHSFLHEAFPTWLEKSKNAVGLRTQSRDTWKPRQDHRNPQAVSVGNCALD